MASGDCFLRIGSGRRRHMTIKDRHYLFAVLNGLLFLGGAVVFGVIFSRNLQPPALGPEEYHALIQEMTDVVKLREMAIRDNVYLRSLENSVFTSRLSCYLAVQWVAPLVS